MNTLEIIRKKREGRALARDEIAAFVADYVRDEVPDDQAAALLMAINRRGLNAREAEAGAGSLLR